MIQTTVFLNGNVAKKNKQGRGKKRWMEGKYGNKNVTREVGR